ALDVAVGAARQASRLCDPVLRDAFGSAKSLEVRGDDVVVHGAPPPQETSQNTDASQVGSFAATRLPSSAYPITRTPTSASAPRAGPRSFWQASTSAQKRSAWPRLVRSA